MTAVTNDTLAQKGQEAFLKGDYELAYEKYDENLKALELDMVMNHTSCGLISSKLHRFQEAMQHFNKALSLSSDLPDVFYNLSILQLKLEEFSQGWQNYQSRFHGHYVGGKLSHQLPLYNAAKPFTGSLLISCEQGVGEQMLFLSLLPNLKSKLVCNFTVEIDPRLLPLYQRTYPKLSFISKGTLLNQTYSAQLPMGDIPGLLGFNANTATPKVCLKACPKKSTYFKQKYQKKFANKKCIGVAWNSKAKHKNLSLEQLAQIVNSHPDVQFINLQYEVNPEGKELENQLAALEANYGVKIYNDPEVNPLQEFDDSAAQMMALDFIVSTSNSAVHLAGCLGVPVHLLLPIGYNWHWGKPERRKSIWYPNMSFYKGTLVKTLDVLIKDFNKQIKIRENIPDLAS